jgi:hypothetical protein
MSGDFLMNAKQLKSNRFAAQRKIQKELLERFFGNVELVRQ